MALASITSIFAGPKDHVSAADQTVRRGPGETLRREIAERKEKRLQRAYGLVFVCIIALVDTLRWALDVPFKPWFWLVFVVPYAAWFVKKTVADRKQIENLAKGLEAETVVGRRLEDFRKDGCRIFHDVEGDGFNIDHVLVSNLGIAVVETKYASKQKGVENKIDYFGDHLTINGFAPTRNPVVQAQAQAAWLAKHLKGITGFDYHVQGAVVYHPNWYVNAFNGANNHSEKHPVWVLNIDAFCKYYRGSKHRLTDEEVTNIDYWLNRLIMFNEGVAAKKKNKISFRD